MRRALAWLLTIAATALACGGGSPTGSDGGGPPVPTVTDRLPDLGMAPVSQLSLREFPGGRRVLRYSTTIVNVGAGPFELHGSRAAGETGMAIVQRVFDDAGGWRDVPTGADVDFGGDGHDHWHIHDLVFAELLRLPAETGAARSEKGGFCFWDNTEYRLSLPGAPPSEVYERSGCGDMSSVAISMGLSVGWGDIYPWHLPDQNVDVSGLPPGQYRLRLTADPEGWFVEADDANQTTWVDVELHADGTLSVVEHGPAA